MCIIKYHEEGEDIEWLPQEEVDLSQDLENISNTQLKSTTLEIIDELDDWVQSPWTTEQ